MIVLKRIFDSGGVVKIGHGNRYVCSYSELYEQYCIEDTYNESPIGGIKVYYHLYSEFEQAIWNILNGRCEKRNNS